MARYYEETALIEFVKERSPTINGETTMECVERAIREAPTADVVPKSEADEIAEELIETIIMKDELFDEVIELRGHLDQVRWERRVAIKQLEEIGLSFGEKTDGYGNLTEYAREIFEEIDKIINNNTYKSYLPYSPLWCKEYRSSQIIAEIAELKKKYTESEDKE